MLKNCFILLTAAAALAAQAFAQSVSCTVTPTNTPCSRYESPVLKVEIHNNLDDTVCLTNLAYDFCSTPMEIYVDGKKVKYRGAHCSAMSGVYVKPHGALCFNMTVSYTAPDGSGLLESLDGSHELVYRTDVVRVKNMRLTKDVVTELFGTVRYEMVTPQKLNEVASIIRSRSLSGDRPLNDNERYKMLYEIIEEYGISSVTGVAPLLIKLAPNLDGLWPEQVSKMSSAYLNSVPPLGPVDCSGM